MFERKSWSILAVATLAFACGDKNDDTSTVDEDVVPVVEITSPTDGATFDVNTEVTLEARGTDSATGADLTLSEITWTAEGWTGASDSPVTVTDLPVGTYPLTVTARAAGQDLSASVTITVNALPVDYTGKLDLKTDVVYSGFSDTYPCPGDVSFTLEPDGSLSNGVGNCVIPDFPDYPVTFTLTGQVTDGVLDGSFVMTSDGTDYETPFTGTKAADGSIDAAYDTTFQDGRDSLRVYGTWGAKPAAL